MANLWSGSFSGHEEGRGELLAAASQGHDDLLRDVCLFGAGFAVALMVLPMQFDTHALDANAIGEKVTQTIACHRPYRQMMRSTVVQQVLGIGGEDCVETE